MLSYIEFTERQKLTESIDTVISTLFEPSSSDLRRGAVQSIICRYVGKKRSNFMKVLINERMELSGYRPSVWDGFQNYRKIKIRSTLNS